MSQDEITKTLTKFAMTTGKDVLAAIVILIVARIVAGWFRRLVHGALERANVDQAITKFTANLSFYLVIAFAVIAVLKKFGVETASLVAVLGAAGFAVGFALQGSLSNFAAGVMLLVFRPFRIGDFVEVGGVAGSVRELRLFTTILNTPDNIRIMVPNAQVFGTTIKNYTAEDTRRVDMTFGIGYGSDMGKAAGIIKDILESDPRVLKEPAVQIAVAELADSSVNFVVRPWAKKEDYWTLKFDVTRAVKEAFDREGIEIPFPQVTVHKAD